MSESQSEEILSAYFDGEATPEECDRIARWLDPESTESPSVSDATSAQTTLDAYRRISEQVRTLPPVAPPAELSVQVMRTIRPRAAVTGRSEPAVHSARRRAASTGSTGASGHAVLAVGLLAVSASLLVVISMRTRLSDPRTDQAVAVVSETLPAEPPVALRSSPAESADAAAAAQDAPVPAAPAAAQLGTAEAALASPPQVGEVLQFVQQSAGQVAIVEVTVVDVREALGVTQVLLAGLERPQVGAAPTETAPRAADDAAAYGRLADGAAAQKNPDWLWGVYIQAPPQQVADVVQRMSSDTTFQSFEPSALVDADRLQQQRLDLSPVTRTAPRKVVDMRRDVELAGESRSRFEAVRVRLGDASDKSQRARRLPRETLDADAGAAKASVDESAPVRVVFVFRTPDGR